MLFAAGGMGDGTSVGETTAPGDLPLAIRTARGLQPGSLLGICLTPIANGKLRALASRLGLSEVLALVDPGLSIAGPRERGQALAALLADQAVDLVLVDPLVDRDEGVLPASLAHHLKLPILLRVRGVEAAGADAIEARLALGGRQQRLRIRLPAVVALGRGAGLTAPPVAAHPPAELNLRTRTLGDVGLGPDDLIEPAPPSTLSTSRPRPTATSDLTELLAGTTRPR